jgi:SAM-dependent methyltransferase
VAVYDRIGTGYRFHRRPEPTWASRISGAINGAKTVVNVGAGTGSYEPDEGVIAAELSMMMVAQRPPGAAPVVCCGAESLPFPDDSFDVALALMTVHHWTDVVQGLAELCRVAPRQVVFTWDPRLFAQRMWFVADYLPQVYRHESRLATLSTILGHLGPAVVEPLPVPAHCCDGVLGAYWRRPEAFLDPEVRAAISGIALLDQDDVQAAVEQLEADLTSGAWYQRYRHLLSLDEVDLGYRLVVADRESEVVM